MSAIKPARTAGAPRTLVDDVPGRGRLGSIGRTALPPFVAFVAGWLVVASRVPGGWAAAFNPAKFDINDSGQYLKIARHGYQMSSQCGANLPKTTLPGKHLCGNVTWFAGYPALMRAFSVTGISVMTAGLIIGWLCWYLTLLMVWLLSAPEARGVLATARRWACLLLAAVFPGQIYFAAIFPISLATFGMLACIYWSTRLPRRPAAFATGLAAGSAYLASVAVLPGLALTAVLTKLRRARTAMCLAIAGVVAGVVAVLVYAQIAVGRWDAYFLTERIEYRVGLHNPLASIAKRFHQVWPIPHPGAGRTVAEQTILVAAILLLALIGFAAAAWVEGPRGVPASDVALIVAVVLTWVIPYIGGGALAVYRTEGLMIIAVPLLRRLPAVALAVLVLISTSIAWHMAPLFFHRVLT